MKPTFITFTVLLLVSFPSPPRSYWTDPSRDHAVVCSVQLHTQLSSSLPTGMTLPFSHLAPAQPVKQWQRKSPFLSSQRTVPPGWQGDGEHWSGISANRRKERAREKALWFKKRSEKSKCKSSNSTDLAKFKKNNKIICLCTYIGLAFEDNLISLQSRLCE